ncbi:MAG TPA: hypothetical protein VFC19_09915 [Candidatus Limnocylindrales bacterium]|nr:hypothetical protein [Candidatus Limnocylindrales bacterium]
MSELLRRLRCDLRVAISPEAGALRVGVHNGPSAGLAPKIPELARRCWRSSQIAGKLTVAEQTVKTHVAGSWPSSGCATGHRR